MRRLYFWKSRSGAIDTKREYEDLLRRFPLSAAQIESAVESVAVAAAQGDLRGGLTTTIENILRLTRFAVKVGWASIKNKYPVLRELDGLEESLVELVSQCRPQVHLYSSGLAESAASWAQDRWPNGMVYRQLKRLLLVLKYLDAKSTGTQTFVTQITFTDRGEQRVVRIGLDAISSTAGSTMTFWMFELV